MDISEIVDLIERDPARFGTTGEVADYFGISSETLRREFFRRMRFHLHEFIAKKRIEKMKHLLLKTYKRCFEICFEVGFKREDTAAKVFKRLARQTMEEYRKTCSSVLATKQKSH